MYDSSHQHHAMEKINNNIYPYMVAFLLVILCKAD